MAAFSGMSGSVLIGAFPVIGIGEWTLDVSMSPVETTEFGEENDKYIPSVLTGSGSFNGNADFSSSGAQIIRDRLLTGGNAFTLLLYENDIKYWSTTARVIGMSPTINIKGKEDISYSFVLQTPVTYV